jgi:competence protein ComEA
VHPRKTRKIAIMASVIRGESRPSHLHNINLALILHNGEHIHVPRCGEVLPTPTPYGVSADGRIDMNLAGAALLETLPGVRPAIAEGIIEYREMYGPFEMIEQLPKVKGIGPGEFEKIIDLVAVSEGP